MRQKIGFTDRLRERGFVDQWGFIVFALAGFAGIVLAKTFNVSAQWVAVGACAVMLSYAVLVGMAGTGRLRADQTGDNCYYLGLVYTLASLSFAIFTFDPDNATSTIVQGFGIALVTTILGLVLRVFFNQGRPDLENVEQQVRLEFMEATSQLKSELTSVALSMNDLSRQLSQSMQEVHSSARTAIETFALQTTTEVASVISAATEAIQSQSREFTARSKRQLATLDTLLSRLERNSDSLEGVTDAHLALAETAKRTHLAAEATSESASALSQSIISGQASVQATMDGARTASQQLATEVRALESGITAIHSEMSRQLGELRTGSATAGAEAMRIINVAAASLNERLEQSATLYEGLSKQVELALAATATHNEGLENELSRSREVFARVHSSFAEMTDSIARSVERNP